MVCRCGSGSHLGHPGRGRALRFFSLCALECGEDALIDRGLLQMNQGCPPLEAIGLVSP